MPHVFISYAWLDGADLARQLHTSFNGLAGWSAWMDDKLHADTVFTHELQMQINQADLVVVVVSPEVNRRDPPSFVQRELAYATQRGVDKPVFAARAADCPLPLIIAGFTYQDFFDGIGYEDAFEALIEKIERSPQAASARTLHERELAYLRQVAQDHGFWGKVYVGTPAEARVRTAPDLAAAPTVTDPDVAAYLGEIVMAIHPEQRHSPDDETATETVESFAALTDALARFERVAIIGDPGSGKTTTLRRFAYALADTAAQDATAPLPVFVSLGGYTGGDLGAYIARQFDDLHVDDYLPHRLVVLLDGLNETAHENVPSVQAWLDAYPQVRVLLTCRKLDYIERRLDLQRVDVLPLDLHRIRQFMTAYKLSDKQRDTLFWGLAGNDLAAIWAIWQREGRTFDDFWFGDGRADSTTISQDKYLDQIREDMRQHNRYPGLLGLVRNPFLLTLTIAIFSKSGMVPRNRGELFNDFVKMLFEQRGKPAARTRPPWIDEATQRAALAALAYQMQRENKGTRVLYAWARGVVAEAAPEHDPDHVLYLAASAGILETDGDVRYTHQLLQEYFAAFELEENIERGVAASVFWPGGRWWETTGWEETAILLAGMYPDRHDWADRVAEWVCPTHPVLACEIVSECGVPVGDETREQVRQAWPQVITPDAPPVARADAGRVINNLGDPRPGVLAPGGVPEFVWCEVPAGQFQMGGDPDAYSEWQGGTFTLDYPFWIAKYPVTVAQYEAFINAGGYRERRWWTDVGWKWKGNKTQPEFGWHDPQWHIANHPVVGVTWYEAYAYAQWLDDLRQQGKLRLPERIPARYVIRLPRECEWEKAARYPDGRKFPWGNDWGPTRLNWGGSGIGRTSAVGMFPNGANPSHSACDLSGNVWEWCLTEWRDSYEKPEAENNGPQGDALRCARGGSWGDFVSDARAATRFWSYPWFGDFFLGFRVVCSVPI